MRLKHRVTKKITNYLFKIMIKKIKNLALHHLFSDWLNTEDNVQNLVNLKLTIQNKQNELTGYKPVIGFKVDRTG